MEDLHMKPWLIAIVVVVVIAVGVGGFFGGRAMGGGGTVTPEQAVKALQSMTPQEMQQALQSAGGAGGLFGGRGGAGAPGGNGGTGANGAGGFVSGSIIAQDSNSITVKLADGSTKIVLYSASTTINVAQQGSASDLAVGKDVTITGTANSDGSVTATRIQMGTLGGFNGGPPGVGGDGAAPGGAGATTSTTASQ
jgi:hypothetical protein